MGVSRGPADWVSYIQDGKNTKEFVSKGREKEYFDLWKKRHFLENNPAMLQLVDKKIDELTDWPTTRRFGNVNDQRANEIDALRMKGLSNDEILKTIDPMAVVRPAGVGGVSENPNYPMGGTPEELRLAQDDYQDQTVPVGQGTGVDPRKLPGEWKNGVLEIPSKEGGKGLRINLNDQPWMRKRKKL